MTVVVLPLLVLLVVVLFADNRRSRFGGGSFEQVDSAIAEAGLQVCDLVIDADGQANQAVASRSYDVAVSCGRGDIGQVVVDEFGDADDRDAAVRSFEAQLRPRGSGVAYTFGRFSLFVFGHGDDAVQDRLDAAFRRMGAA